MEISTLKNQSSHRLQAKNLVVVFNPASDDKADVWLFDQPTEKATTGEQKVFDSAGEYEVSDTMMEGVQTGETVSYKVEADGVTLVRLGEKTVELTDKQIEALSPIDILMIPCGELTADQVSKLVSALEPRVIVPIEANDKMVSSLASELGVKPETVAKLKINHKDLPTDSQKLIVLGS